MFDFWETTVQKGTAEADAIWVECHISPGVITEAKVYFPPGCRGVPKCRVYIGERPLLPRSAGSYITGAGFDVGATGIYEPTEGELPFLKWELWNPSTKANHTLELKATWVTEEELATERALLAAQLNRLDAIARALGGI